MFDETTFFALKKHVDIIARKVARQPWSRRIGNFQDILQEAYCALLEALRKFDPDHPSRNLKGFVCQCVFNHLRGSSLRLSLIRVPTNLMGAKAARMRPKDYRNAGRALSIGRLNPLANLTQTPAYPVLVVQDAIRSLPPFEQEVVSSLFGIGRPKETGEELGKRLVRGKDTISIAKKRGLRKLKRLLA